MVGSGEGAGEADCFLATLAPGGDHGGDHCGIGGDGDHGGGDHDIEVDYQIIPDCQLVTTIMSINPRLQVEHLVMFASLDILRGFAGLHCLHFYTGVWSFECPTKIFLDD